LRGNPRARRMLSLLSEEIPDTKAKGDPEHETNEHREGYAFRRG